MKVIIDHMFKTILKTQYLKHYKYCIITHNVKILIYENIDKNRDKMKMIIKDWCNYLANE